MYGSIVNDLMEDDYIIVTLPPQVKVKYTEGSTASDLYCLFLEPATLDVKSCQSISNQKIKIVIDGPMSYYFQFDVSNAITNPPSTTFTDSVIIQTFRAEVNGGDGITPLDQQDSEIFIAATSDTLLQLQMASSVSQYAGDKNTLQFGIKLKNYALPGGMIQVIFPYLFYVEKDNIKTPMVDKTALKCQDLATMQDTNCTWDAKTNIVTLRQIIGMNGKDAGSSLAFSIAGVINPIATDAIATLTVRTIDINGGIIDTGTTQLQPSYPNQITSPQITADTALVQESTRYTIKFSIGVPIYQGSCQVAIFLPFPDFKLAINPPSDVQGFGLFGTLRKYSYSVNTQENSIIIRDACSYNYILGSIPATIYLFGLKNPEVAKSTDPLRVRIWQGAGEIAELTTAKSPSFQIVQGSVSNVSLATFSGVAINKVTDFTLTLRFQHQAVTDTSIAATSYPARIEVTFTDLDFTLDEFITVKETTIPGSSVQVESMVKNKVTILVQNPQILASTLYSLTLSTIKLAGSRQTMGPVQITLLKQWFTGSQLVYYPIDNGTFSNLITTVEGQFLVVQIQPESYTTSELTTYSIDLTIQNDILQGGYLIVTIPQDIVIEDTAPQCLYNSLKTTCSLIIKNYEQTVKLTGPFIYETVPSGDRGTFLLQVLNIRNPRSLKTTGKFTLQSFDKDDQLIDFFNETNTAVSMSTPATLALAALTAVSSLRVGDQDVAYTFSVALPSLQPLQPGDFLTLRPPTEDIDLPVNITQCSSPSQPELKCSFTADSAIKLILSTQQMTTITQPLTFTVGGFKNPKSGRQTGSFQIGVYDSNYFDIAVSLGSQLTTQMTLPQIVTQGATLTTDFDIATSPVVITIQFYLANDLYPDSNIIVAYPEQLSSGLDPEKLKMTSPQSTALNGITLEPTSRLITGLKFFSIARSAGSLLELRIEGFKNPAVSDPTGVFTINIQTPEGLVIDQVLSTALFVKSKCNYPCKDCDPLTPNVCTACNTLDLSLQVLLQEGTCVKECRDGLYQFGNNLCSKCDPSCLTCDTSPLICTSCPDTPANRYLFNFRCVQKCDLGYFQNEEDKVCQQCTAPCKSCDLSTNTCASCQSGYYLFRGTCLEGCPANYYIENPANWTCDRCNNECQTCQNDVGQCTSCKPGYNLNMLINNCSINDCPTGITAQETIGICAPCKAKCATCDPFNTTLCESCSPNLFYTPEKDCVVACKSNQATSKIDGVLKCLDCAPGCTKCEDNHPEKCTQCTNGLVNFNFSQCLSQCPVNYQVNERSGNCLDARKQCKYGYELNEMDECELAVQECLEGYSLNGYLNRCIPEPGLSVPFPFIVVLGITSAILTCRVRRSPKHQRTRLLPVLIMLWGTFELPLFLAQAAFAAWFEHWFALVVTMLGVILHFPVNIWATRLILPSDLFPSKDEQLSLNELHEQESNLDIAFKHWSTGHLSFLKRLRCLSFALNHKYLRALTCGYNLQPRYLAMYDRIDLRYTKPTLRISIANLIFTYLLILIADVFALKTVVKWGYQFTIFCIESALFVLIVTTMELVEYCKTREKAQEYFKVSAKSVRGKDVFGAAEEGPDGDPDQTGNYLIDKQRDKDKQVSILRKLNQDLTQMKVYTQNFDKLNDYNEENCISSARMGKRVRWLHSPSAEMQPKLLFQDEEEEQSCLSTQNHYGWNKEEFYEWEYREHKDDEEGYTKEGPLDYLRPYHSLLSEDDYPDPQALHEFREEFDEMLRQIIEDDMNRTKTLDYKASFHILNKLSSAGGSESDFQSARKDLRKSGDSRGMLVLQKPARFNLSDVMGHFETDPLGNMVIVKQGLTDTLMDALGRKVNRRGYLIDEKGNIISKFGEIVVPKEDIDPITEDIPAELFRELFIPYQVSRNNRSIRKRALTGKQRASGGLLYNSSSSGFMKSRDTQKVSNKRRILSDGESQHVTPPESDEEDIRGNSDSYEARPRNEAPSFEVSVDPTQAENTLKDYKLHRKEWKRNKEWKKPKHQVKGVRIVSGKKRSIVEYGGENLQQEEVVRGSMEEGENYQINIQMKSMFNQGKKKKGNSLERGKAKNITIPSKAAQSKGPVSIQRRKPSEKPTALPSPDANTKYRPMTEIREETPGGVEVGLDPIIVVPRLALQKQQHPDDIHIIETPAGAPNTDQKPPLLNRDLHPSQSIDALVNQAIRPIRAPPAKSVPKQRKQQPQDSTLYRIHLDVDEQVEQEYRNSHREKFQANQPLEVKDFLEPAESQNSHVHLKAPSFLAGKQGNSGSKNHTLQHSINDSESFIQLDHEGQPQTNTEYPLNMGGWVNERAQAAVTQSLSSAEQQNNRSAFNISGRLIMKDNGPDEFRNRFYQQRPPSGLGSVISPATSIQYAQPMISEARVKSQERRPNAVSSAYAQNLTLLLESGGGPPKSKKKRDEDPFEAQMKQIFKKK